MKGERMICLQFHDVTDRPHEVGFRQPTAQRYKHSVEQFRTFLDVVEAEAKSVAHDPLLCAADAVIFTFDDGGSSSLLAADALQERGWRGIFFVTTNLIGKRGFVTRRQVADLVARQHIVGSHSCSHPDVFRDLSREDQRHEWQVSRSALEQLLGQAVDSASVPGGEFNRVTLEEASAAGYRSVFTSRHSACTWQVGNSHCFGRFVVRRSTSPAALRRWIRYPRLGALPVRTEQLTKTLLKATAGPVFRRLMARRRSLHEEQM